jgi:hypothetical protein
MTDLKKRATRKTSNGPAQNSIWTGWMSRARAFSHAKALAMVEGTRVKLSRHCAAPKGGAGDYWATTWTW